MTRWMGNGVWRRRSPFKQRSLLIPPLLPPTSSSPRTLWLGILLLLSLDFAELSVAERWGAALAAAAARRLLLLHCFWLRPLPADWDWLTKLHSLSMQDLVAVRQAPYKHRGIRIRQKFWIIQEFAIVNSEPIHNVVLQLGTGFEHCLRKSLDIFSTACHQFQK